MTGNAFYDLLIVALPIAALAWWWSGAQARELAVGHARHACRARGVQFLDQSVALSGLKLVRGDGGAAGLRRVFAFEFTAAGEHRDHGTVTMRGQRLVAVNFPWVTDEEGNRVWLQ